MTEIELPIWDIPSLIWDMVEFGLQHQYSMAYRIIQKVDAKLSSNLMIFIMQLDSFYQAT
jgi:hypothetical protein